MANLRSPDKLLRQEPVATSPLLSFGRAGAPFRGANECNRLFATTINRMVSGRSASAVECMRG